MNDDDNLIDFTDSCSSEQSADDNNNSKIVDSAPLSYLIKICGINYKIDFDQMKQISVNNSSKKRFIKRIEVHGKIENKIENIIENIETYLKNSCNVLGVSGVHF